MTLYIVVQYIVFYKNVMVHFFCNYDKIYFRLSHILVSVVVRAITFLIIS